MHADLECPYCGAPQNVCHDDGQGYEEDFKHEMQCDNCDKYFVFDTYITYNYSSYMADCLNGEEHKWKQQWTFPKECTKMGCEDCSAEREPTEEEWKLILNK
jgi:hypothetical protein